VSPDSLIIFCGINIVVGVALWWPHRRGTALFLVRDFVARPMSLEAVATLFDEIPPKARKILDELERLGTREVFEERVGLFRVATAFVHSLPTSLFVVRRLAGGSWRLECASCVDGAPKLTGGDGVTVLAGDLSYRRDASESVDDLVKAHAAAGVGAPLSVDGYFNARRTLYRKTAWRAFRRDVLMAALGLGIIGVNVFGLIRVAAYF
jgi:hypothetical protein